MLNEDAKPYEVRFTAGRYEVVDASGRSVMVCGNQASAQDYAVLLGEAFRRGYKAGYRDAKKSAA